MQVRGCKLLLDPMVVENAVRRYETCWLPLVAAHAATRARSVLAPPLDVAWVWLLHVLDPSSYAKVCSSALVSQAFSTIGRFHLNHMCRLLWVAEMQSSRIRLHPALPHSAPAAWRQEMWVDALPISWLIVFQAL